MEPRKIKKSTKVREKEDADERSFMEGLDLYTMVPPSPYVLKKRRKNINK